MKKIKLEAPDKEQLELAEEIKKVHLWLRQRTQEVGSDQAWKEHLSRTNILENYSKAMKLLATEYWSKRNSGDRRVFCRIEWTCRVVKEYFNDGLREKLILKEMRRLKDDQVTEQYPELVPNVKLKLLDVGSCYNPFNEISMFDTFAIDLCPAVENVKKCNFLEVNVDTVCDSWRNSEPIVLLPKDNFDVVVFSLFLEYLPAPDQRLKACKLAWATLNSNGVLIVITPDSNHETANSVLMKTWKLSLAQIGFIRFKIEKLKFLYCMAFRKTLNKERLKQLPEFKIEGNPVLNIPQDFVKYNEQD